MKVPISDQFLWELYNILQSAGEVADFIFSSPYKKGRILTGGQNPVFRKYRRDMGAQKFNKLVYYLKTKNYITVKSLEGKEGVLLSKKGISKALKASFTVDPKKKREDGKWIMLTFDIPQQHKKARMLLRSIISNLGYKMFQQSIWICPYDVSNETEKLLQMHGLDRYVKIFLIEKL